MRKAAAAAAYTALLVTAGCAVGPDYAPPPAPDVAGYTPKPLAATTAAAPVAAGAAQHFVNGQDLPGTWWQLFRSPALDALVRQALAANPDLQAAQAALRQAREAAAVQGGALLPHVDASGNLSRNRISGAEFGQPGTSFLYSLATAQVAVSYSLDIFGGLRRAVEAAEAQTEYQRFQVEAAYLTLTSNVVVAAVQEAALREQIAATRAIAADEARQLEVVRRQFDLGGASKADVLAQEATLAQTRATLPDLEKQLAQQRNLLAALTGRLPSQGGTETLDLAAFTLPTEIPVSLPSRLVEQRPDIRAAGAQLHYASAEVGVATANMLPQVTLSASYGSMATAPNLLFGPGSSIWTLGSGLTQPLFHGGQLLHQKRAAEAAFDQAAAQYRSTVLTAFRNVADALRALQTDADAVRERFTAERAAADSLDLARQQYADGGISYLTLLNAENTASQARISLIQAQAGRLADTAALFQALGGGWWNRADVSPSHDDDNKTASRAARPKE